MLKKSQCVSIHQFVQHVEQLNVYIAQLPCWHYSPSIKPSMIPMNVPLAEADLESYIPWMCPHSWQDQFNLHKKGMPPMDMCLLLLSLKAIECICTQDRSNAQSNKKASHKGKKGNKRPGTKSMGKVPKQACTKKHCNLRKKHGGTYTTHNNKDYCRYKDRTENLPPALPRQAEREPIPQSSLLHI
jgi:hypothetical protein